MACRITVPTGQRGFMLHDPERPFAAVRIKKDGDLLPGHDSLKPFASFCEKAWETSLSIVAEIRKIQKKRNNSLT